MRLLRRRQSRGRPFAVDPCAIDHATDAAISGAGLRPSRNGITPVCRLRCGRGSRCRSCVDRGCITACRCHSRVVVSARLSAAASSRPGTAKTSTVGMNGILHFRHLRHVEGRPVPASGLEAEDEARFPTPNPAPSTPVSSPAHIAHPAALHTVNNRTAPVP